MRDKGMACEDFGFVQLITPSGMELMKVVQPPAVGGTLEVLDLTDSSIIRPRPNWLDEPKSNHRAARVWWGRDPCTAQGVHGRQRLSRSETIEATSNRTGWYSARPTCRTADRCHRSSFVMRL